MAADVTDKYKTEHVGDSSYASHLMSSLNQLRKQGMFCDVTINVGNQRFQAHKAVLSASSSYFMSMFASGFQESKSSEVTIEGSAESFAQLLEFAYTGYFHLSPAKACSVLQMAIYMNFTHAITVCKHYLLLHLKSISMEDIFGMVSIGDIQVDLSDLVETFHMHLLHQFPEFSQTMVFLEQAGVEFLFACLEDEHIETDTTTEEKILQGVLNWLKYDWDERKTHTIDLLKRIRLGLVPVDRLEEILGDKILAIPKCREMVDEVLKIHATKETATVPFNQSHPDMFATRNTITALLSLGVEMEYYHDTGKGKPSWKMLPKFRAPTILFAHGFQPTVVRGQLYVARFHHDFGIFTDFVCYNKETNAWDRQEFKLLRHTHFSMLALDGYIYAIGGITEVGNVLSGVHNLNEVSKLVERYSVVANEWEGICPLAKEVEGLSAVVFHGKILLMGTKGIEENVTESSMIIQMYNPLSNKWYEVLNYRCQRGSNSILTVQNNECYFILQFHDETHSEDESDFKVFKLICEIDRDPPKVYLGEEEIQRLPSDDNPIDAFFINDEAFVNVHGCIYKLRTDGSSEDDFSHWLNIRAKDPPVVCFTFDKRLYM